MHAWGLSIDLGSPAELAERYKYGETFGTGQGFASLRIQDGKVVVRKGTSQSAQPLEESSQFFKDGRPLANVPVKLGHIYLARITDRYDKTFQRMVKFVVIAYTPEQAVTIRWRKL